MTEPNDERIPELRALAGIPDDIADDPTPAEASEFLTEQAALTLDRITPKAFRRLIPLDHRVAQWAAAFIADPDSAESLPAPARLTTPTRACGRPSSAATPGTVASPTGP